MWLNLLLLALGFALLVKGGNMLVDGASALARKFGVSDLVIGLTIVAFGTSMPEFLVSALAAWRGNTEICIGNVVGSNIANILLILGVSAIIYPPFAARGTVWKEIPFMLLATAVLAVMANDRQLDGAAASAITRTDGLVMLGFFIIFLYYVALLVRGAPSRRSGNAARTPCPHRPAAFIIIGLALLALGGHLVVYSAVELSRAMEVSERIIGLTIVAIGTSLPELATSAAAAWKRNSDIAVGNIVGSNIFNILWILGVSSLMAPLPIPRGANTDLAVMAGATLLLFMAMFTGKPRRQVQRAEGAVFLALYMAYLGWLVIWGA